MGTKRSLYAAGAAALCASAALIGGAEAAVAHTTFTPTTIVIFNDSAYPPGKITVHGYLDTASKCRADRRVKIFFHYSSDPPGTFTLVDQDKSSSNGNWAGSGDLQTAGFVRDGMIRVTRKNIGPSGHLHICEPDTEVFEVT